jgi:demethylmenaquinone methyltransferase/2-methoxy-6-polyprenyl-1,4-benzoquinol methylase
VSQHPTADDPDLLAEQVAYYGARAPEYERWFDRGGRYDRGPEANRRWQAEVAQVRAAFDALPLDGVDALELAPGTGLWTRPLAARAARVHAVDASPEMVAENTRALDADARTRVTFELADLFAWRPDRTYDAVVVGFFLSHVPVARLDGFLETLAAAVRPGGLVFLVDSLREETSTAADHVLPGEGAEVMVRRLDDGREYRVVKNFWDPDDLTRRLGRAGLVVPVRATPRYFLYGTGTSGRR